ncbi:hypothetical protein [sulfur-oxidizing endosymbiont of Gigantopelta aegis]|uniref:hypothetical protein n=1 Tax=sulfur-oxidizing endosymbiont of Gigantopelta aegis TaxID=2794934 RepID=UPI0018DB08D6|nr:hypothetical protein [sulfur-oxidizing endosymbiont of Gigantopelta aegis]
MSELDTNRLLLQFEQAIREINREEINPKIAELKVGDLNPVIRMVAKSRAQYLQGLFELSNKQDGKLPDATQIKQLKNMRETYEELLEASIALEVAIERGYLDVDDS